MTTMLFPDPRMRSPTAMGDNPVLVEAVDDAFFTLQGGRRIHPVTAYGAYGLTWACNDVDAALTELKGVIDIAIAKGLLITHWFSADEGDPTALQAQATYKGITNNNLVIMSDAACQANAGEARAAADSLRAALAQQGVTAAPLRPDYQPGQQDLSPLDSIKPYLIGGGILVGLITLAPVIYELVAVSRTVRRRKYSGRRR